MNISDYILISQDANTIKKVFIQRKTELEHAEPTKSSLRIRYKKSENWGEKKKATY